MFSSFEEQIKSIKEQAPQLGTICAILEAAEGSEDMFSQARDAILTSFKNNVARLQNAVQVDGSDQQSIFFVEIIKYRQAIIDGIERGETTHFVERTGNGVTIPGSSRVNTAEVRWSWMGELLNLEEALLPARDNDNLGT